MSEAIAAGDVPLMPLQTSIIDEATVDQLFFDIEHAGELLAVQVKSRPGAHGVAGPTSLEQARQLLVSGAVLAVQLHYRAQSQVWCDTLLRTPDGMRIVRAPVAAPLTR